MQENNTKNTGLEWIQIPVQYQKPGIAEMVAMPGVIGTIDALLSWSRPLSRVNIMSATGDQLLDCDAKDIKLVRLTFNYLLVRTNDKRTFLLYAGTTNNTVVGAIAGAPLLMFTGSRFFKKNNITDFMTLIQQSGGKSVTAHPLRVILVTFGLGIAIITGFVIFGILTHPV